jgi:hypothetical protein
MTPPSRATSAGRAYLDLQKQARAARRPVDEYLQFYVLECFLDRLSSSRFAERFVLKGGVLLAAFGERRPTRDIDFLAQGQDNDPQAVLTAISEIASIEIDDGVTFDLTSAKATSIRTEDMYPGARVTMCTQLWTARTQFHVDVNVGDPIHPPPNDIEVPRLLGGELTVRGYPLAMVLAEKIVTAVTRGTQSTRWRDFADIYLLSRHHQIDGSELNGSIREVAAHRDTELLLLSGVLDDYGPIGQAQWSTWLRRQQLTERLPTSSEMSWRRSLHSPIRPSLACRLGAFGTHRLRNGCPCQVPPHWLPSERAPLSTQPSLTLWALQQAVAAVTPERLPEMLVKMQEAFVRAGEEGTVAPIHMFHREWAVIVQIERHPDVARRLHAAEQALMSDDPQVRDAAVREGGEIVRTAHRAVAGEFGMTGTGQARPSPRGMRAALDAHYTQYPEARPDLADIAIATAELDGNQLAADPPDGTSHARPVTRPSE